MTRLLFAAVAAALILSPAAVLAGEADKKKNKGPDLEAAFTKLDADKDGKLSATEFAKVMDEVKKKNDAAAPKKPGKAGKRTDALFTKLDADKNGSLSKDEFKKLNDAMQEIKMDKKKDKAK